MKSVASARFRGSTAELSWTSSKRTDDLRESPVLELVERLLGKGYDVRLHDEAVMLPRLVGANREHLLRTLPHVAAHLVDDLEESIQGADVVVVAQGNPAYADILGRVSPEQ